MVNCKHIWYEIESDNLGKPTKYKCINCPMIYEVKRKTRDNDYYKKLFDKMNSLINRIKENEQKIRFIKLNPIGFNEKIHIAHLEKEIATLNELLKLII